MAGFEFKLPHGAAPFERSAVADDELLLSMVKLLLLNSAVQLDTFSTVVSLAGAPAGAWHSDVEDPFAFHGPVVGGRSHAPPPGLVAVVPLVDLEERSGPTAFRLGSHVKPDGGMWDRGDGGSTEPADSHVEVSLPAERGTVILFDLRVEHRGGPNRGEASRPILYLGYTNRWYRDVSNFHEPHTVEWEQMGSGVHRALYARLDSQEYVRSLEEAFQAHGGDLAALKAQNVLRKEGGGDAAHNLLL